MMDMSPARPRPQSLAEGIYQTLKDDVLSFRLLPGDWFSEGELAERLAVSRTPVRQALHRLQREGYVQVHFRSGWQVCSLDMQLFEELYEVRIVLEQEALRRLCQRAQPEVPALLQPLLETWLVPADQQLSDGPTVAELDERFHCQLLDAAGNREMARLHAHISERIRLLRRLDFTEQPRIDLTYAEHGQILQAVVARDWPRAQALLAGHIQASKAQVRRITLHHLQSVRAQASAPTCA